MGSLSAAAEAAKPYVLMTASQLCLASFISLLHSAVGPSHAVNPIVLVVYENILSSLFLSSIALLLERGKWPPLTLRVVGSAVLAGFLHVTMGQLLFASSLRYVTASFQSVALNTNPAVVFVLAVALGRERFRFFGLNGQAKLWGVLISIAGGMVMVLISGSGNRDGAEAAAAAAASNGVVGVLMNVVAVFSLAIGNLIIENVAMRFPTVLTLSAMITGSGTIITAIAAVFMERNPSSWMIRLDDSIQLLTILYGGIAVTGLSYLVQIWCINKKGPVFSTAFSPLLIVFSFLLETLITGTVAHPWSIVGAVLVVGGLYLLLWAKAKDLGSITKEGQSNRQLEDSSIEPLLLDKA